LTRLQDPLSLAALSAKALHRGVCKQRHVRVVVRHPQRPQAASGISYDMQVKAMPYAIAAQGLGMTDDRRDLSSEALRRR